MIFRDFMTYYVFCFKTEPIRYKNVDIVCATMVTLAMIYKRHI